MGFELQFLELKNIVESIQRKSKKDLCVYYCLIGDYDDIDSISILFEDGIDYFLITNQNIEHKRFHILKVAEMYQSDRRTNRFFKLQPHLVFESYKASIYLDTNLSIVHSVKPLFNLLEKDPFVIFEHNKRNCVYDEIKECKKWKRDNISTLNKQKANIKSLGIPRKSGLYLGSVLIRKQNQIKEFSEKWWANYEKGSSRDQISLVQSVFETDRTPKTIPYTHFERYFSKLEHKSLDISEKNLNKWEIINLKFMQIIYKVYRCLKVT